MNHRILFVIESLYPVGPAQSLLPLCAALTQQQYEVQVAVLGQRQFEPVAWSASNIAVHFVNGDDSTPLHTWRDGLQVVRDLRKLIERFEPEIVHSWCGISEWLTLLATQDLPLVTQPKRCRLISTELYKQPEKRFTRQFLENRMGQRVERMLVPHQTVQDHLVENGYRENRINVVASCFCSSADSLDRTGARRDLHARLGLDTSNYIAGTVAPLHPRMRLKDLIWAVDLITCIRDDVHLAIIGTGLQLKRLKRFAALTESKSHIHFLGHPEHPQQLIAGFDFYWHSHLRNPMCTNLLTALASGIPTVSVYGEGTSEIIQPQETGLAVNFGARNEFASWTKFLLDKPDSAQKLGEQGRNYVRRHFAPERMINDYIGIYDLTI